MPGVRTLVPLRNIGLRYIKRPPLSHTVTGAAPGSQGGSVTWLSCQIGRQKNPEKPQPFIQPEWISITQITVIRNPNYIEFTDPCSKFE